MHGDPDIPLPGRCLLWTFLRDEFSWAFPQTISQNIPQILCPQTFSLTIPPNIPLPICITVHELLVSSEERKKKGKEIPRCDKSHICPDHPHCATPTKVVMWGGVPGVVNHDKFRQNRFRGFGSLMGQNLPFSYAWRYGVYNGLGLPPAL